ncbi:MAG: ribokinase [Chloroflexi bacterium]|nr:ribokinase [Chloroflexota bacterium]
MSNERWAALIARFAGRRIVVVGDVCYDEYIVGAAQGLSREAPVPVLEWRRRFGLPGAAANPACNVSALGGRAALLAVVGADEAGAALRDALAQRGIDDAGLVVDPDRPTITKTRIVAEDGTRARQQIVRVDRLDRRPLGAAVQAQLCERLAAAAAAADAVLLSDYKAGVLDEPVIAAARELAAAGRLVAVDSQGDLAKFRGCTVVKVNQQEGERAVGRALRDDAAFAAAARQLQGLTGASGVVVTRGADGLTVLDHATVAHLPALSPSEVFDVTGAGDTVIAVLTLALAGGATLVEAAQLADVAAGLVVRRFGNATVTPAELGAAMAQAPVPRTAGG